MTITAEELKAAFEAEFKDAGPAYNHFDSFKAGVEFALSAPPTDLSELRALMTAHATAMNKCDQSSAHREAAFAARDAYFDALVDVAPALLSELARLRQDEKRLAKLVDERTLQCPDGRTYISLQGYERCIRGGCPDDPVNLSDDEILAAIDAQLEGK